MKKYNVLIVGAGGQGALSDAPGSGNEHKIISFAKAFKQHPGFEIAGIVDKNHDAADKARQIWGVKWWCVGEGAHSFFFDNYAPPLTIDIAVVATPDDQHYKILKELAGYPLKLVICEKPLCTDLQQAREIVELYKAKGIPLMCNYTRRFIPELQDLKRRYEAGEFGELCWVRIGYNRGLLHTGSHAVDFICWLLEECEKPEILDLLLNKENFRELLYCDYRIWQIQLFFERYFWQEQRIGDMPVPAYYDKHMWHVTENAHNFLEGREALKCTGEDSLRSLEICFELMGAS